ncbi:hypothetical protein SAMN05421824_2890 [Hyunsoonleella jejuensis]|uniref:Outer membrane protein beta-barrel domain-containing protein n=1 Tax=Hyunsoonleella jejuensis TaxID=419940 RepID=A0A1H9L140_9FLAO|nr:hypothetical protein [Hyunsoonleella jejuensis]SER04885.1 hypothetical protein SAMN05421824_2890 [Hyunsoonleella jejuensis]
MKCLYKFTLCFCSILFYSLSINAQGNFSLGVYEDIGLGLRGDEHGHPPGTLDVVIRGKYNFKQQRLGYWLVLGEFEFAELAGDYKRYSGNIGYAFNKIVFPKIWFIPRFEMTNFETNLALGYGIISRFDFTKPSFGWSLEFSYKLTKWLKINVLSQGTQRTDMVQLYSASDRELGFLDMRESWFFGLEFVF